MKASDVPRAVAAGVSTAAALDLRVDDAVVLHDSNKLTLRLLPCDVLARVAPEAPDASGTPDAHRAAPAPLVNIPAVIPAACVTGPSLRSSGRG